MNVTDICRVCLCGDRRMYAMSNTVLRETWEKLTNAKFNTKDWKPLLVCYICGAQLRRAHQLMKRAQKAEELLTVFIVDGFKQSQMINSLREEYNYKCVIENLYILECTQFKAKAVEEIKQENEAIRQKDNAEDVLNIIEEEGNTEKENVEVTDRVNEERNVIDIKEEQGDNIVEDTEKENVGVSDRVNEEENVINIKEELGDNNAEETEIETVGVSDRAKEEEDVINIKEEVEDSLVSHQEEEVDIADVEGGADSRDDTPLPSTILESILEREVRIVLEKIDLSFVTRKRKLNEVSQKAKRIKHDESLSNGVSKSLPNNNCKVPVSEISKSKQTIKAIVDSSQVNKNLRKVYNLLEIQAKNIKNSKKCLQESAVEVTPSTSLDRSDERNQSNACNRTGRERKFSCHLCQFKCITKNYLNIHLRKHSGEKPYSCDFCDYRGSRKFLLESHIKYIHTKEKNFSCDICPYKSVVKSNLIAHLRKHTMEGPYLCDVCDYKCLYKSTLVRHIGFKHMGHIRLKHTKEKIFSCPTCQRKFAVKRDLNRHLLTHTGMKPYKCDECDHRFARKDMLMSHMNYKHAIDTEEKSYKGEKVDNRTTQYDMLKIKKFTCDICQYKFVTNAELKKHIRKHTGEKPYKCDLCGYRCARRDLLTSHTKYKHTKEKNYSCPVCQYKFVTKSEVNKHLRTHSGEKPYKCEICDRKFANLSSLNLHVISKHAK